MRTVKTIHSITTTIQKIRLTLLIGHGIRVIIYLVFIYNRLSEDLRQIKKSYEAGKEKYNDEGRVWYMRRVKHSTSGINSGELLKRYGRSRRGL
jgi:hypothetical protein